MLLILLLCSLAFVKGTDVGCSTTSSGGQQGKCVQRGCCHSDGHVTNPSLCNGQDEVCCYRADICTPSGARREHRGIWVATVFNIDWPNTKSQPTSTSQQQLTTIFDIAKETNMNAVYLQVRPMGDALYQSSIEPWSEWLTGTQGTAPNPLWDPLQYAIDEGHRRGIEVHAWLNPYRANVRASTSGLSSQSMCRRYSQYCYPYGTYMWMDPGAQVVQDHLYNVIMNIAANYQGVDGIHFDDYFYPYPVSGVSFPDDSTYNDYINSGGSMARADWRRDNVNKMVQRIYTGLRGLSNTPFIKFSIGPFGIYRPGHPEGMPPPIQGLDQYSALYADPKLWMNNGWLDIVQPQLYWRISAPNQPYQQLLEWWLGQNTQSKIVAAGLYLSQIDSSLGNWPVSEIQQQVAISRQYTSSGSLGNLVYSYKMLRDNVKSVRDLFKTDPYPDVCLQPAMPWLQPAGNLTPPQNARYDGSFLRWDADSSGLTKYWSVYSRSSTALTLLTVLPHSTNYYQTGSGNYFVRGLDGSNREGPVSALVTV